MKKNKTFTLNVETLHLLKKLETENSINLSAFTDKLLNKEATKLLTITPKGETQNDRI